MTEAPVVLQCSRWARLLPGTGLLLGLLFGLGLDSASAAQPGITAIDTSQAGQTQPPDLKTARPGARFGVEGGDFPGACPSVFLRFDTTHLATVPLEAGGSFLQDGLTIPASAAVGKHVIAAACSTAPGTVLATYEFQVAGAGTVPGGGNGTQRPPTSTNATTGGNTVHDPRGYGDAPYQSQFEQALRAPNQVSWRPVDILRSALLVALLVGLIAFPSELFNATLQEHYDEVKGWFGLGRGDGSGLGAKLSSIFARPGVGLVLVTAVSAVLYGFLDPTFGFNLPSLALFVGLAGAIAIATFSYSLASGYFIRLRHGHHGYLRVFPAALVVGLVCVVISRVTHFLPGYLFGVMAAFRLKEDVELPPHHEGRAVAVGAGWLLGVSVVAWLVWIPVKAAAGGGDPSWVVLVLSALLAGVFVAGIEGLLFGLIPLRFLDGQKVMAWNRFGWAAIFAVAAFLFVHVLLNPAIGYVSGTENIVVAVILFGAFGVLSVGFWAYFRFRVPHNLETSPS
ncbi:MAG: FGLLP motif-containing membrane protein [Candidatus Dormibacteria bacterium]